MMSAMDDSVGETVAALKAANLYDNTIFVFSGDVITRQLLFVFCIHHSLISYLRMVVLLYGEEATFHYVVRSFPSLKEAPDSLPSLWHHSLRRQTKDSMGKSPCGESIPRIIMYVKNTLDTDWFMYRIGFQLCLLLLVEILIICLKTWMALTCGSHWWRVMMSLSKMRTVGKMRTDLVMKC